MKKENSKIVYIGYIVLNDKNKKSNFAPMKGYNNCQILLKNLTSILASFNIKRTKDYNKITFNNNIFIQPYNSEYHIKIEKIII